MNPIKVKYLTSTAMMTAILCILAPFSFPIGSVPISAATFVVYLAALLLGMKRSLLCVVLYLLLGAVGLPIFNGWSGGFSHIVGPTGGYLIGYLLIAFFTGWFMKLGHNKISLIILGMIVGTLGCYAIGTIWLAYQLSMDARAALMAGVIPFIPGDIAKMILSIAISLSMRKQLANLLDY